MTAIFDHSQKLADWAIRLWQGDERVIDELRRFVPIQQISPRVYVAKGMTGITCGLELGADPIAQASQLGFLFYGMLWAEVVPNLLKIVDKRWKEITSARKRGDVGGMDGVD